MNKELPHQDLLAKTYLFAECSPDDLRALAAVAEAKAYKSGDHVYRSGEPADALYALVIGTVDIVAPGKTVPIMTVGSGQLLGELAFFTPGPRAASAVARESTRVQRVAFDALGGLLAARPALERTMYRNACRFMGKHLRQMSQELNHRYL